MERSTIHPTNKLLLNIAVILILLTSGSVAYLKFHGIIAHIIFIIFPILFYYKYPQKPSNKSFIFIFIYCSYLLMNFYIINNTYTDYSRVFTYVIFAIGSYLMLCKISYEDLADRFIKIVGYMAFISILIYFFSELHIIPYNTIQYNSEKFCMLFYHTIGWASPFHRLAGIYWEPGVYQIILNTTLLMSINYFNYYPGVKVKKYIPYLAVILIASLLTLSTTGYVVLVLLVVYFFFIQKRKGRKTVAGIIKGLISFIFIALIILFVYLSNPIQDKLAQLEMNNQENSALIRQADNYAMLQMITEMPIWGYGLAAKEYAARSYQLDNRTSSNGDLAYMATFGIPFYLFIIFTCYFKSKKDGYPALYMTILFIALNMGENFMYHPLVFIFLIMPNKHKFIYTNSNDKYV